MTTAPCAYVDWNPNIALRLDCLKLAASEGYAGVDVVKRALELEAFLKEAV